MKNSQLIGHIESLEGKTTIFEVNIRTKEGRDILDAYSKSGSTMSFNEFLTEKYFKDSKEKIVIGEIIDKEVEEESLSSNFAPLELKNGDFSGTKFTNVEISSLTNVKLRDCHLEKVRFLKSDLVDVDFRGSTLEECDFFNFSDDVKLENVRLAFANPSAVTKKSVISLFDHNKAAEEIYELNKRIDALEKIAINAVPKVKREKTYFEIFMDLGVRGARRKKRNEESYYEYDEKGLEEIERIKESSRRKKEEGHKRIIERSFLEFSNPDCDPTYMPDDKDKEQKKSIKASKELLETFLSSGDSRPFNEYFSEYCRNQEEYKDEKCRIIADFSHLDLSSLDLSNHDFSQVNFSYCNMQNVRMKNSTLIGTCFEGASFDNKTDFEKANLTDANMVCVSGREVNFNQAIMIRTRMLCAFLIDAKMENTCMYAVNAYKANFTSAKMENSDLRSTKLKGAILQHVDARNANLRKANLESAILVGANFAKANLESAILESAKAHQINLTNAILNEINAEFASFKKAVMDEMIANGANFSNADLEKANLKGAQLKKALLNKVNAKSADFSNAVLTDVQAIMADFSEASLKQVEAERIDLRGSVLKMISAEEANLREAVMQNVNAQKANFTQAILEKVDFESSIFTSADFTRARMNESKLSGAKFVGADFNQADLSGATFDEKTLLVRANLVQAIGAENLRELQNTQNNIFDKWFAPSRYGICKNNNDGTNDRFKCQRIGAAVLASALGGGAGYSLAGPFAGLSASALSAFLTDKALEAIKDNCYEQEGFIHNAFGDKLAELGAIAIASGVAGIDRSIDYTAASLICSSSGVLINSAIAGGGGLGFIAGAKMTWKGQQNDSEIQKFIGASLMILGSFLSMLGFSGFKNNGLFVFAGAGMGAVSGGIGAMSYSISQLAAFEERDGKIISGMKPEEIYNKATTLLEEIKAKIVPTVKKIVIACALAATFVGVSMFASQFVATHFLVPKIAALMIPTQITAAATGFILGYLYDRKITNFYEKVVNKIQEKFHSFTDTATTNTAKNDEQDIVKATSRGPESLKSQDVQKNTPESHKPIDLTKTHTKIEQLRRAEGNSKGRNIN